MKLRVVSAKVTRLNVRENIIMANVPVNTIITENAEIAVVKRLAVTAVTVLKAISMVNVVIADIDSVLQYL